MMSESMQGQIADCIKQVLDAYESSFADLIDECGADGGETRKCNLALDGETCSSAAAHLDKDVGDLEEHFTAAEEAPPADTGANFQSDVVDEASDPTSGVGLMAVGAVAAMA